MSGRGGGWVVAQFALMALCFLAVVVPPDWPARIRTVLSAAGAVVALCGVAFAVWASRALGRALTPFPRPVEGAPLVASGPYGIVRHPLYSSAACMAFGAPLLTGSLYGLIAGFIMTAILALRSTGEEKMLKQELAGYGEYMKRVRWRLIPYVF